MKDSSPTGGEESFLINVVRLFCFGGLKSCLSSCKSAQADLRAFVASASPKGFQVLREGFIPHRSLRETQIRLGGDGGVGTASASATVNYNTSGYLQPINSDGTSMFKYNSTIPVKISFTNCDGSIPANLAPTIKLQLMSGSTPVLDINEPISTSAADTTGVMRFSTNQYIYNLATKPLPDSSATYLITVTIPSTGQTVIVQFGLRP